MIKNLLCSLILILMTSCFGETNCPRYPESKLNWLPYKLNDVILFADQSDTIEFIIEETFLSDAYSSKNNCKCTCEANALFRTGINNSIDIKIEAYSIYDVDRTNYEYYMIKYGGDFYSAQRSDYFYFSDENNGIIIETIPEFTVGDKAYYDVLILELDTIDDNSLNSRDPDIWKLIIAESVGIIQFHDRKSGKTWSKVK